jgi:hypothetical protein
MGKLEDFVKKKSELTNKILDTQIGSSEFVAAYKEYKTLFTSQIANTWSNIKTEYSDEDEAYFYKLLADFFVTSLVFDMGMTAERLAGIMRIDKGLHRYCKKQTSKGKSFGSLEYSKMLEHTAMIEDALKQV